MTEKRFSNHYDGVEGYLIEDKKDEVVFLVEDRREADDITKFLNKQDEIINTLQKDAINTVEIIKMKQTLDEMIEFHEQYKDSRAINNIKYDCLTALRKRWFK